MMLFDGNWLLFLSQLPASPSSPRVMVWRRLKGAGAIGLQNGAWILPQAADHTTFLNELLDYVKQQGGMGYVFVVNALDDPMQAALVTQFDDERQAEYEELIAHSQDLQAELEREIVQEKFTYGELEEAETNWERLAKWLATIQERDFFLCAAGVTAVTHLARSRELLDEFTTLVYAAEGMDGGVIT
jgi:hypothetical protein